MLVFLVDESFEIMQIFFLQLCCFIFIVLIFLVELSDLVLGLELFLMLLVQFLGLSKSLVDFDLDSRSQVFLELFGRMLKISLGQMLFVFSFELLLRLDRLFELCLCNGVVDLLLNCADEIVLELGKNLLLRIMFVVSGVMRLLVVKHMFLMMLLLRDDRHCRLGENLLDLFVGLLHLLKSLDLILLSLLFLFLCVFFNRLLLLLHLSSQVTDRRPVLRCLDGLLHLFFF